MSACRPFKSIAAAALSFAAASAIADPPAAPATPVAGKHVSFVTCPIFRDAARQCWLAENQGEIFDIARTMLATPPQLLHKVLVEGEVAAEPRSCGGIVLQPIHVSIMPEIDRSCDTVLPDNGAKATEPSFADFPPALLNLIGEPLPMPSGPFSDRTFVVTYSFNSAFVSQESQQVIETAAKYAIASKAKHIEITGFAARSKLDDGSMMVEDVAVADQRASGVSIAMAGIGANRSSIKIHPRTIVASADGIHDAENRRVIIRITDVTKGKPGPATPPPPSWPLPPGATPPTAEPTG
jgi:outer membrane protein OmpA-like peptidoglycan-associated protein